MWNVIGQDLKMAEGDWGIQLPITITGTTFAENDAVLPHPVLFTAGHTN